MSQIHILKHLPESEAYIEPFAGSLAIFLNKKPRSRVNVLNDRDGSIVHFYKTLRERPEELARAVALSPTSRTEHQSAIKEPQVECDIETARRTYIRISQSMIQTTQTNNYYKLFTRAVIAGGCSGTMSRLLAVADALVSASLENKDAIEIIEKQGDRENKTLFYCDPPYMPETRNSKMAYSCEMSIEDHTRFLDACNKATCMIAISGYDSKLYQESLSDWRKVSFPYHVRVGKGKTDQALKYADECLWMNYAEKGLPSLLD